MYIFILSIIIVSIISLCFYKKKFWENRYLVLLIISGVALVSTLTTNYTIRGSLGTDIETIWKHPIQVFSINDSLTTDSSLVTIDEELSFSDHRVANTDSTINIKWMRVLIYGDERENLRRVGYFINDEPKYNLLETVYIAPSENDSTSYFTKRRLRYKSNESKWVANLSLPHIETMKCFYIPPVEYAMIPDSLIREIPF